MNDTLIFLPALAQIALTLAMYVRLSAAKSRAARAGLVNEARRGLHDDAWPDNVIQINNNIRNQFEIPVLFYALVFALWALHAAGPIAQCVAWLFVLSRVAHAYIHTGSNYVPLRRRVFTFGVVLVMVLTILAVAAVFQS